MEAHPELTLNDVRSTPMGVKGVDVQLSEAAQKKFPFSVECKARRSFDTIYGFLEQSEKHRKAGLTPIAVIKGDRRDPLIIFEFKTFMNIWKELNNKDVGKAVS